MNENTNRLLEERLGRLERRTVANRVPQRPTRRPSRARRTKVVTAGASAGAIVGLMALYGMSNPATTALPATETVGIDPVSFDGAQPSTQDDVTVVIDSAGNVISAPAGMTAAEVDAAVANALADGSVSTTSLAPVAESSAVDLASPAVEQATTVDDPAADTTTPTTTTPTTTAPTTTKPTTTTPTTTTPTTTTASASPARRAPQARSTGS